MFGTYRLLLAVLVLFSHAQLSPKGFNIGISAVIAFFLLSGYVVTGVLKARYTAAPLGFYTDRLLRIYPQFLLFCVLTLVALRLSPFRGGFLGEYVTHYTREALLLDLLIVPMDFFTFNATKDFLLIPPAWSLGLELTFYLVFPFVYPIYWRRLAFWSSFAFFCVAAYGVVDANLFGYRLLPGTLFFFLTGSLLFDQREETLRRTLPIVGTLLAALVFVLWMQRRWHETVTEFVLVGYLLAVVGLVVLSKLKRRSWDEQLGALSYGIFLSHTIVLWSLDRLGGIERFGLVGRGVLTVVGATFLGTLGHYLVERPVFRLQRRWRERFAPPTKEIGDVTR